VVSTASVSLLTVDDVKVTVLLVRVVAVFVYVRVDVEVKEVVEAVRVVLELSVAVDVFVLVCVDETVVVVFVKVTFVQTGTSKLRRQVMVTAENSHSMWIMLTLGSRRIVVKQFSAKV